MMRRNNMARLRVLWLFAALCTFLTVRAQDAAVYKSPRRTLQLGFDYGHFKPQGGPSLHSDLGGARALGSSFWVYKPSDQRFKLGIDVMWLDFDYCHYQVNMTTFQGGVVHYDFHQGALGVQAGLGGDFHLTRDWRAHIRVAYNPAFACEYVDDDLNVAFASSLAAGLFVTWRHVGLGLDMKFGKGRFKNVDPDDDSDVPEVDNEYTVSLPGTVRGSERMPVHLSMLRASLVFTF